MKLIIRARQTGKTFHLAQELKWNKKALLVVGFEKQKELFCDNYNFPTSRVLTAGQLRENINLLEGKDFYIDELDGFIGGLLCGNPKEITYTGEVEISHLDSVFPVKVGVMERIKQKLVTRGK